MILVYKHCKQFNLRIANNFKINKEIVEIKDNEQVALISFTYSH